MSLSGYRKCTEGARQKYAPAARSPAADHVGKRSGGSFHRFQELPCELRLMVWKDALTPRLVAVKPRRLPKEHNNARNLEISLLRGIPVLLAVNQESRYLALRHYTWRFTIDLVIDLRQFRQLIAIKRQRARVVMSPEDTLGLFQCDPELQSDVQISKFSIKVANEKNSPWKIHQTTDAPGPQRWFKKVAVLGEALETNFYIIKALNITPWDLDSILHDRSTVARTVRSPHTKHKILITSTEMKHMRQGRSYVAIMDASSDRCQLENRGSPDIRAFVLSDSEKVQDWDWFLGMLSQRAIRPANRPAFRRPFMSTRS